MHLMLYRIASLFAEPFIGLWLKQRVRNGKEDAARLPERLGYTNLPRPEGKLVWLHGASVGESLSILPLLKHLTEIYPGTYFLVTTGTVNSALLMKERLPTRCFHQFAPVDTPSAVRRFLHHWKPEAAFMVESEIWPNLWLATSTQCPIVILNGRMSERSFAKWQKRGQMATRILSQISLCLAQSEADRERYALLGAPHTAYPGNLKFDAPALPDNVEKRTALQAMLGSRKLWVAASTHPGEEEQLAAAHARIRTTYPDALLIIIPRHPHRGMELKAMFGKGVALRSADDPVTAQTAIYIADTMGELGIFYRISPIVFIGGSLVPHGGQNPLEPARLDCALITGPHTHNFVAVQETLRQARAIVTIDSEETLAAQVIVWISDVTAQKKAAANAHALMRKSDGIVLHYSELLAPYLMGKT